MPFFLKKIPLILPKIPEEYFYNKFFELFYQIFFE